MTTVGITALIIFLLGYIGITLEHKTRINKAAFALLTGTTLWILVGIVNPSIVDDHIIDAGSDIFSITIFLLSAMSLVEILIHYRLFDVIRDRITSFNMSLKAQFFVICFLTFFLSAIIDNMTATIVAIQIARKFFWGRNLLIVGVAIVIVANAGGVFSPIGDVTTIMLWIAGKFSAIDIIVQGFLPSLAIGLVATFLLSRKIEKEDSIGEIQVKADKLTSGEKVVISSALFSFLLPILVKLVHLPPVVGILFGVGFTWLVVDLLKGVSTYRTHLTASIENLIQKTDISSIKYYVGILLAVSALSTLGVLVYISGFLYGDVQTYSSIVTGNILIGLTSSMLDNIPLTAIAMDILNTADTSLWVLLAITVGTGGSILPIGSAAGIMAMSIIKGLNFKEYFKIGFIPALLAFMAGIGVWGITKDFYHQDPVVAVEDSISVEYQTEGH